MNETDCHSDIIEVANLSNKHDFYKVLEQVVLAISEEILQCDSVGIFLSESQDTFRGVVGIPNDINGMSIEQIIIDSNTDLFYKEIIETRKHIYIPDTAKDSRPDERMIKFLGIKSLFGLPICYENEIYGLVSLFNNNGSSMDLTQKDIHAVESYIKIAAVAIRNAKLLYQEQELLLKHQAMLSETIENWKSAQERFSKVFELNPVAMSIVSKEDNFINVNQSWLEIFDLQKEEVIGKSLKDSVFIKGDEATWKLYRENRDKEFRNQEYIFITDRGEERKILYTNEMIEMDGETCILNVCNDVTVLRKLEGEVSRYDRLNLVAQMAAGIAHEIRNPMTTVRGFLQLLKNKDELKENAQYYDLMIEELDRANGIISEFLSLAKEKDYELEQKNLNDILDIIFPLLMADAIVSNVVIELEKGSIPKLLLDEKQIRQLVFNLVRNGIEAMSSVGKLVISTADKEDEVLLIVEDSGSGIPVQLQGKIGNPFFTTKDTGTGLGLSVCHSIAKRHTAVIDIESKDIGTRVIVRFKK